MSVKNKLYKMTVFLKQVNFFLCNLKNAINPLMDLKFINKFVCLMNFLTVNKTKLTYKN